MLQKQYVLLHHAVYEALATENFVCTPGDLDSKLMTHQQSPSSEFDLISEEYMVRYIQLTISPLPLIAAHNFY